MIVKVVITLGVPRAFDGTPPWTREQSLDSYISNWLEEGYYIEDYNVNLPNGIVYKGYEIELPKKWRE